MSQENDQKSQSNTCSQTKRKDGHLTYVVGRSRSGKSAYVKQKVAGAKRLLIWDVEGEYAALGGFKTPTGKQELFDLLRSLGSEPARVAYQPQSLTDFDYWCQCAFMWNMEAPACFVAEEIADVTGAGKAPQAWGILIRRGLKYQPVIYAVTQRPAEADKTILGNAPQVHIHAPNTDADAEYLASKLGVGIEDIPTADLYYLDRFKDRTVKKGKLSFAQ